jgi:hypothetical protein
VVALRLALFGNVETLYDGYRRTRKQAGVDQDSGALNCRANKPGEGIWTDDNGDDAGRYLCYVDANGHAWLHWTYDMHRLWAYVYREDGNIKGLDKWWDDYISST